jgi:hypothetical protein
MLDLIARFQHHLVNKQVIGMWMVWKRMKVGFTLDLYIFCSHVMDAVTLAVTPTSTAPVDKVPDEVPKKNWYEHSSYLLNVY